MHIPLFNVYNQSLFAIAIYQNSFKPSDRKASKTFLSVDCDTHGHIFGDLAFEWGWKYDTLKFGDTGAIRIKDLNTSKTLFQTEPIFDWYKMNYWDLARTLLATETQSFWIDIPDDLPGILIKGGVCT